MSEVNNPNTKINLIRHFFGATLQEMKALTETESLAIGIRNRT